MDLAFRLIWRLAAKYPKCHLSDLVFGKDVQVFGSELDRTVRFVGTVVINEADANLEQLRAGSPSSTASDFFLSRRPKGSDDDSIVIRRSSDIKDLALYSHRQD
jgi:hypothetical protein